MWETFAPCRIIVPNGGWNNEEEKGTIQNTGWRWLRHSTTCCDVLFVEMQVDYSDKKHGKSPATNLTVNRDTQMKICSKQPWIWMHFKAVSNLHLAEAFSRGCCDRTVVKWFCQLKNAAEHCGAVQLQYMGLITTLSPIRSQRMSSVSICLAGLQNIPSRFIKNVLLAPTLLQAFSHAVLST